MIPGEDHDEPGRRHLQGIDVLEDRIGGPEIPTLVDPLLGWKDVEKLTEFSAEEPIPTQHQVPVEAHGFVLGEHLHPTEAAVDAVGKREVNDPVSAAEGDGRLGTIPGERVEASALSACQNDGDDIPQRCRIGCGRTHRHGPMPVPDRHEYTPRPQSQGKTPGHQTGGTRVARNYSLPIPPDLPKDPGKAWAASPAAGERA